MLAKSLTVPCPAQMPAGIVLGARVPIILTSRAIRYRAARLLRGGGAGAQSPIRPERQSDRRIKMADVILVLNAGSSSIKFSLF